MASGETGNYGLSQWVESDRILLADFNADNAAIDAALKENADAVSGKAGAAELGLVRLASVVTTAEGGTVSIDLSGIDLTQYGVLWLQYSGKAGSAVNPNNPGTQASLSLRINEDAGSNYEWSNGGQHSAYFEVAGLTYTNNAGGSDLVTLCDSGSGVRLTDLTTNANSATLYLGCGFAGVQSLQLTNRGLTRQIAAGFRATVYGLKK